MEKEIKTFKIDYSLDWTYGIEIKKIREDLDAIEKLGATHVDIELYESYGSAYVTINATSERIETDEECLERINKSKLRQEQIKKRELEQLAALKQKYEV
jgi:hypothetical protein